MTNKLFEHRRAIAKNPAAYTFEIDHNIDRLTRTLIPYIRFSGFKAKKHSLVLSRMIVMLFEAQEQRPIFHVEGTELPLCWNSPGDWDKDCIKYEWGHLKSKNQNPTDIFGIENFALYSARCNKHIQSSMNIEELMVYGGILAQRISNVLTKRRNLFASQVWHAAIAELI
jgi:hypothetical protein